MHAGEQLPVQATFTPTAVGRAETLVACCTAGSNPPAGFGAVSHVKGLAVSYAIQQLPLMTPLPDPANHQAPAASGQPPSDSQTDIGIVQDQSVESAMQIPVKADFGLCNIGQSKSLVLTITNQTLIAAPVRLWLDTFQTNQHLSTSMVASHQSLSTTAAAVSATLPLPEQSGPGSAVANSLSVTSASLPLPEKPAGSKSHAAQHSMRAGSSEDSAKNKQVTPGIALASKGHA